MAKLKAGQIVWVVVGGKKYRGDIVAIGKIGVDQEREAERESALASARNMPERVRAKLIDQVLELLPPRSVRVEDDLTVDVNYYAPDDDGHEQIVGGVAEVTRINPPADGAALTEKTWWPRTEKRGRDGRSWEEI